ncbi:inorganic phosphate transporter [Fimbriiglobus ruber]|uniref:inorganic phosphate transporter n=1 Tax=Fimbriiglobus ruber TaxID=1908690 RepID=UPI0019310A34
MRGRGVTGDEATDSRAAPLPTPEGDDRPPTWIRVWLLITCGGVSFAHGSNDGQKGMGLILLVLIGFVPFHYALNAQKVGLAAEVREAAAAARAELVAAGVSVDGDLAADFDVIEKELAGKKDLSELSENPEADVRWHVRGAILRTTKALAGQPSEEVRRVVDPHRKTMLRAIEFVPLWVVVGVAVALGVGTTIGYKRIVVTVAEKIGKTHLTYAQGAAAEMVAAMTIGLADVAHLPVSTTHVLSSGVAGTMAANHSGIQGKTLRRIALAWVLTLPVAMVLAAALFAGGLLLIGRLAIG